MSELLLLAAGLLSRASAAQPLASNLLPVLPPPADAAQQPEAEPTGVSAEAIAEPAVQPEFSRDRIADSRADDSRATDTQGRWTGRRRSLRPVAQVPRFQRPEPEQIAAKTGRTDRASAASIAAAPDVERLLPAPSAFQLSRLRPQNGPQQYRQRWAALQRGLTYTRVAADSFYESWADAIAQPTYEQWVALLENEARAMAAGQGDNRLSVLIGDSISQWFPVEQLSRDRFWLNQGISGDTTTGVLRRLSLFQDTRPADIHVMVGINDLRRGASNEEVLMNLHQIMRQLRQSHPNARVLVYSILPTRLPALPPERIDAINQSLEAIAVHEKVAYVNLQRYFAEETSGILRRDLTTDGLHLSQQGYALWQWVIGYLSEPGFDTASL